MGVVVVVVVEVVARMYKTEPFFINPQLWESNVLLVVVEVVVFEWYSPHSLAPFSQLSVPISWQLVSECL